MHKKQIKFDGQTLEIKRGHSLPLGSTVLGDGINFSIFSRNATEVTLVLFSWDEAQSPVEIILDPNIHKTGNIWHAYIRELKPWVRYGYRMDRAPNENPGIYRFDKRNILIDPYAQAISGRHVWGLPADSVDLPDLTRRGLVVDDDFDWGDDQPLNIPLVDTIIYELHVRGFTQHSSSGVKHPGTYKGLEEKIPYLQSLGVTAVELLPVNEFEDADSDRMNPVNGERLLNYWGYSPISYFALKRSYSTSQNDERAALYEFKSMVKAFHAAGIEVILDVVFNHTAEGDERGATTSFRGIDNAIYYIIDPETGQYHNYSGCGNTLNCNHPVVRDLVLSSLHYWVTEMHIDGFRFDLASILGRGRDGSVLSDPPLLERIAEDPVLANTKLIAEAWDAAGLYQVGSFPAWSRWSEWNGRFRDDIRGFVRGDSGMVSHLATRLTGSADLYQTSNRAPYHSINFVTSHDGFTLRDLVSYNEKHNEQNGEDNRDGDNHNLSWNCGVEGPSDSEEIKRLRIRQMKNIASLLLLSNGVPMILAGDEIGRTQHGNNNAYCQDNEISWIDWNFTAENEELLRFFRLLIQFRTSCSAIRRISFEPGENDLISTLEWHGTETFKPDWSHHSSSLAKCTCIKTPDGLAQSSYLIVNASPEPLEFKLPHTDEQEWFRIVDTALPSPDDIVELIERKKLSPRDRYRADARSVVLLLS